MGKVVEVEGRTDARVRPYLDLSDRALRDQHVLSPEASTANQDRGHFIIESPLVLGRLVAEGADIESAFVLRRRLPLIEPLLKDLDVPIFTAADETFEGVVGFPAHRGVFALARRPPRRDLPEILGSARRVVLIEDSVDQVNTGALFRSASALGIDAVLLGEQATDPLYRRVVRVSMGASATLPWVRAPVAELMDQLSRAGFLRVGLTPRAAARPISEIDPLAYERVALILGAEGPGLTRSTMSAADLLVRIPMTDRVDSLNLAAAAAIAMHRLCEVAGPKAGGTTTGSLKP